MPFNISARVAIFLAAVYALSESILETFSHDFGHISFENSVSIKSPLDSGLGTTRKALIS